MRVRLEPDGWGKPEQRLQGELFDRPRDYVLALATVTTEHIELWRSLGWISFDVLDVARLHEAQISEVPFIRNLAHSGLSHPQITALLSELQKPYCYDPVGWRIALPTAGFSSPCFPLLASATSTFAPK
jgi:hypothetical protein